MSGRIDDDLAYLVVDVDLDAQVLLRGEAAQDVPHLARELRKVDRLGPELHLAGLDLRQIEHVVDQLQQVPGAGEDVAEVLPVLRRDRPDLAVVHQLGEADDRVERRAQLVRHVGEELALEPVGLLHPRASSCLRSVMSRMALDTSVPPSVFSGLRLISTGNSVPSLRSPNSSSPSPSPAAAGRRSSRRGAGCAARKRSGTSISTHWPTSSSRV